MITEAISPRPALRVGAPVWITIGIIGAGVGQFALVWASNRYLNSADSSSVLLWNSASLAVGLFIASPTVALMIVRQGGDSGSDLRAPAEVQRASLAAAIVAGAVLPVVWLSGGASTGSPTGDVIGCLLLATSPAMQVLAATQRGLSAASSNWWLVALQLAADGVFRAVLGIACASIFQSVLPMLFASWLPLTFAVLVVRRVSGAPLFLCRRSLGRLTEFGNLVPLWATGLAEHAVLTLSPNVLAVFSSDAELVEAFSLIMFCIRVPISLATVVLTPLLVRLSSEHHNDPTTSRRGWVGRLELRFLIAAVPLTLLGMAVGPRVLELLFNNELLSSRSVSAFATVTILALLLATTLQQYLWSRSRFSVVAWSWVVASVVYVALVPIAADSLTELLIVMTVAGAVAAAPQSIAARKY